MRSYLTAIGASLMIVVCMGGHVSGGHFAGGALAAAVFGIQEGPGGR